MMYNTLDQSALDLIPETKAWPMATLSNPYQSTTSSDESLPHGGIVMYCTSWCPDCRRARVWLKEHNLEYIEIDVEKNPQASAQVKAWAGGNRTTPTFDIDGTIIVNFNLQKLTEALADRLTD